MMGFDITVTDITAQMTSFISIPVVIPLIAAGLAISIIVLVAQGLRSIFPMD